MKKKHWNSTTKGGSNGSGQVTKREVSSPRRPLHRKEGGEGGWLGTEEEGKRGFPKTKKREGRCVGRGRDKRGVTRI